MGIISYSARGISFDVVYLLYRYNETLKFGFNELGYNEHSVITNKYFSPKWSLYYINQPGYNEPRL